MATFKSNSLEDTKKIAGTILEILKKEKMNTLALIGDLGAGKTALTQIIAELLEIKSKVSSPTFVLMNEYEIRTKSNEFSKLFHIDLYRLDSPEETNIIDIPTITSDPKNLVIIEWADKIPNAMPDKYLRVEITQSSNTRTFKISTIG